MTAKRKDKILTASLDCDIMSGSYQVQNAFARGAEYADSHPSAEVQELAKCIDSGDCTCGDALQIRQEHFTTCAVAIAQQILKESTT